MTELETPRLLLREWRLEDREAFADLNGDPEVMRYLGGAPLTRHASDALADRIAHHFAEHGFGLWAVEIKGEAAMAGFIGLAYPSFLPEVMPTVEVGWRLARDVWGRGLATEGASECLRYAFGSLGFGEVCSIHAPDNTASRRVMEKLGMHFDRDTNRPDNGEAVRVFKITRDEWVRRGVPLARRSDLTDRNVPWSQGIDAPGWLNSPGGAMPHTRFSAASRPRSGTGGNEAMR